MTTTTPEAAFEEAIGSIRELNERILDSSKKAGIATLDTYEVAVNSIADFTEKLGKASRVEWVTTAAATQAGLTRELASAYTSAAKAFLS